MKRFFHRKFSFVLTGILMVSTYGIVIYGVNASKIDTEDVSGAYSIKYEENRIELVENVKISEIKEVGKSGSFEKRMGDMRMMDQNNSEEDADVNPSPGGNTDGMMVQTACNIGVDGTLYLSFLMHRKRHRNVVWRAGSKRSPDKFQMITSTVTYHYRIISRI